MDTMVGMDIVFAEDGEEQALETFFQSFGMWPAGEAADHVVMRSEGEIKAAAMLWQMEDDLYHLAVFAVDRSLQGTGIGKRLLTALTREPEKYCRWPWSHRSSIYEITTAAKGSSQGFYKKNGFKVCAFSALAEPFDRQCLRCDDRTVCDPVAMIFRSERGS